MKGKSAVDYRRTFEEISSRDVGNNSPRSPPPGSSPTASSLEETNNTSVPRVDHAAES